MTDLDGILREARDIWGRRDIRSPRGVRLRHIGLAAGVVVGDLLRQARDSAPDELGEVDWREVQKELGNLLVSSVRWLDDLGFDLDESITKAFEAQRRYRSTHG